MSRGTRLFVRLHIIVRGGKVSSTLLVRVDHESVRSIDAWHMLSSVRELSSTKCSPCGDHPAFERNFESIIVWVLRKTSSCSPLFECFGSHIVKRNEHLEELGQERMKEMKRPQMRKIVCTGTKPSIDHVLRPCMNQDHGTPGRFCGRQPPFREGIQMVDAIARWAAGGRQVQLGLVRPERQALGSTAPRGQRPSTAHVAGGHTRAWEASTGDGGSVSHASCVLLRFTLLPVLVGGIERCCIV